jgi:hypothetical protein
MKGKILFYDAMSNSGKISGEDSVRYDFVKLDWKGAFDPKEGLDVDFDIIDGKAKDIFVVQGAISSKGGKSFIVTLLLAIFLGPLGMHRFYTGHVGIGIIQLLTGGGCGIWFIIDIIMIVTGSYTDVQGYSLVKD